MPYPLVSIAVPVYNVEKYIRQCLDSLVNQTMEDIEILIVNDGSTDLSGEICKEYAEKDSRIKLICKENGGLASARQVALEAIQTKYFCVCDADDWLEPTMCENLYNEAIRTNADVVMCDYWSEYGEHNSKIVCWERKVAISNSENLNNALNGKFPCSIWAKLFKKSIFEQYNLFWEYGINMGEDFLMMLKILQHPIQFTHLKLPLYHYRRMPGENSYTNKVTMSSYNQMLRIQDWILTNISKDYYSKGINHYQINIAYAGLRVKEGMSSTYYKSTSLNPLKFVDLLNEMSLKSFVIIITKIFGYHMGVFLYKLLYKIVYK